MSEMTLLWACRTLVSLMIGGWCVGQCFRDATWLTGMLFYIPSPVVVLVLLTMAVAERYRSRNWQTARVWLGLALLPTYLVLMVENHFGIGPRVPILSATGAANNAPSLTDPKSTEDARRLRLVHWNVYFGRYGWDQIVVRLRELEPDLIILSESPAELPAADFPGCQIVRFRSLSAISRYPLELTTDASRSRQLLQSLTWHSPAGKIQVLMADFPSQLTLPRHPLLVRMRSEILSQQPDLVVGDLNAPRRSRCLADLPKGYHHAYDAVGSGWSSTWPMFCPLYALDHTLFGPRIEPVTYHLESHRTSDHRLQVFDFRIGQ